MSSEDPTQNSPAQVVANEPSEQKASPKTELVEIQCDNLAGDNKNKDESSSPLGSSVPVDNQQQTFDDANNAKKKKFPKEDDLIVISDDSWLYTENRPVWFQVVLLVILVGFGVLEGVGFNRAGMGDPNAIPDQFTFKSWIVFKLLIAAVGASAFFQGILAFLMQSVFKNSSINRQARFGVLRNVVGGFMSGCAMSVCGAGPTILPSQLAAGTTNAWVVVLGMIAGGFAFGLLDYFWLSSHDTSVDPEEEDMVVDEMLEVAYWKLALPGGLVMFGFACALEWGIPGTGRDDDSAQLNVGHILWPAVATGAIIGFNQIVIRLISNQHGQGGARSIMNVVSLLTWGKLQPKQFPNEFSRIWQLFFVWLGTSLGGLASMETAGPEMHSAPGFHPARGALGGFFLVIGARLGGVGCACGTISGASEFSLEGVYTMISMMCGGVITAFIIQAAG